MPSRRIAVLLVAGTFLVSILAAQKPRGPELRISTHQGVAAPRVGVAANGDFVVTWQVGLEHLGQVPRVWYRLFRADGAPKTKPLRVSTSRAGEMRPQLAMAADGSFIIVWTGGDSRDTSAFGRRFDPRGRPLGGRFLLSASTEGSQYEPAIALTAGGGFVAAWTSAAAPFQEESDVYARRFDAAGNPLGTEFLVNNTTVEEQSTPQVAAKPDGGFLIGWLSYGGEPTFYDSFARVFTADGAPQGDEFQLNSGDTVATSQPEFALAVLDDGTFVAVWTDNAGDFDQPGGSTLLDIIGLRGQRFATDGTPIGGFFHINASVQGAQENPAIVSLSGGGFFVTWVSRADTLPFTSSVMGRRFSSDAVPAGPEVRLSVSTGIFHLTPALALAPNGTGVVAWTTWENGHPERSDVLLRRLQ